MYCAVQFQYQALAVPGVTTLDVYSTYLSDWVPHVSSDASGALGAGCLFVAVTNGEIFRTYYRFQGNNSNL